MNDLPAFYDPTTKTVYVSDDLKPYEHLYRFALHRAFASALLDQQFDWSTRLATATPAAAFALRAMIDGDALAVANSLAEHDAPDQLAPELLAFVQGHPAAVSPSQFAAAIVGRAGVSMRPTLAAMPTVPDARSALEQSTPASDAVLNVARPQTAEVPTGQLARFDVLVLRARQSDRRHAGVVGGHPLDERLADRIDSVGHSVRRRHGRCRRHRWSRAAAHRVPIVGRAAPAESTTTVAPW